jgi:hypothetical protein
MDVHMLQVVEDLLSIGSSFPVRPLGLRGNGLWA